MQPYTDCQKIPIYLFYPTLEKNWSFCVSCFDWPAAYPTGPFFLTLNFPVCLPFQTITPNKEILRCLNLFKQSWKWLYYSVLKLVKEDKHRNRPRGSRGSGDDQSTKFFCYPKSSIYNPTNQNKKLHWNTAHFFTPHFLTEHSLMVWGKQITIKFRETEAVKGWKLLQGSGCGYKAQHMCAHLIHIPAWRLPICSSTCFPVSSHLSHFLKVETWAWINNDDSFTDN